MASPPPSHPPKWEEGQAVKIRIFATAEGIRGQGESGDLRKGRGIGQL